ncbi:hypothetical protein K504DRAFT_468086 [Pleomassaria siparia CBS 279.74]|uniref:Uncharacterized protein n=1 Tax=Pleomassaria siparia CBS 279.74 TaxID=1314801 RepID=A0A6G1K8J1_9PLEO|nr:hypothetical protein K504DRAFT_468086 [Pleomassaria siparia CBS 279.74]
MNRPRNSNRPHRGGHRATDGNHPNVPYFSQLRPGTPVAIILKQDQPTGHRVYGVVGELLTKGDHPRGVKVRLRDGRVGRVQKVVEEAKGREGEDSVGGAGAGLGRDGETIRGGSSGGRGFKHTQDVREDGHLWDDQNQASREYFADVQFKVKGQKKGKRKGGSSAVVAEETLATCPVCGAFEGDERAVAHHVEQHFQ